MEPVVTRLVERAQAAGAVRAGRPVAEYAFHLAGGEVVVAPIRERSEIQVVPPVRGRLPFLAVTDTSDHSLPRFEGRWDEAGIRLTEHAMGWPAGYYLWCWENPHPDRLVERVEFIPRGARFVVAGITTSDLDEHPFVRGPACPVRLVVKDGRNGVFDVAVDRGVATYPQPLPGADDRAGWGAAEGTSAYTSIAALPSATVAVRQGGHELGLVRWGDVERDGRADVGQVVLELAESGRNWVHVRVVDDATGGRCRAGFISVRPGGFRTSRTATTITSRKISAAGITTSAVTSGWASAATRISTAPARDGYPGATSWWRSRAGSNTSRSGRPYGSSRGSGT